MNNLIEYSAFNHPYLYLYLLSFIFSLVIIYKTINRDNSRQLYVLFFILSNLTLGVWAFLAIFKLLLSLTIIHIYIHFLILITATINVWALIMFIYYYTNPSISRNIAWGSSIPLLICIVAVLISNYINFESYNIYVTSKDISFYMIPLEQSLSYQILVLTHFIYGFVGLTTLYIFSRRQKQENKSQYYAIIIATLIIFIGAAISTSRFHPYPNIHIYPVFFSIFFIIVWKSIYSYNFFKILPIARTDILENLAQGIIFINKNNKIIDVNESAKQIFNSDNLYMKNIYGIHPVFENNVEDFSEKNIIDNVSIDKNNETKYYNITIKPLYDNSSTYSGSTISFEDITKLNNNKLLLEEQKNKIEKKNKELQRQNKKLENFASVLSHDIRNPLNVAKGYAELIKDNPENQEHYKNMNEGLDRIEDIIDSLLELATQNKEIEKVTKLDLESISKESWGMLNHTDAKLNIVETIEFEADEKRIKNVFENLFRNAQDHSSDDIQTKIQVGPLKNKNGFYIEDNGPGIPKNKRDSIFDYGITHSPDGTGLGLGIVKDIINAHSWDIIVKDGDELSGARFEIIFNQN